MIRCIGQLTVVLLVLPAASVRAESLLVVNLGAQPSAEAEGVGGA